MIAVVSRETCIDVSFKIKKAGGSILTVSHEFASICEKVVKLFRRAIRMKKVVIVFFWIKGTVH